MSDADRRTPGGQTDRRRTTRTRHRIRPPRPQTTAARSRYGARKPKAPRPAPTPRWPTGHGSPRPPAEPPRPCSAPHVCHRADPHHRNLMRRAHTAGPLGEHHASTRRRSGGACTGPSPSRPTRRARPGPERSTAGGGSSVSTKSRGRRRPMTRQLASRQVEGEAAIDRPASLVHAVARCRSGGSAPGFCQRLCQTLWQNQAGTPGPTGAELASGRISAGGVCSPMVGVAARPEPGRASAWARFRAAPSAACTSHPVELLAQVVCCRICHVVRRHWARSPIQRAVSRLWIVPADRRSRECSNRTGSSSRRPPAAAACSISGATTIPTFRCTATGDLRRASPP
jgi:hypothetical protein